MIKRKYFVSGKVAHNNGTGDFSWWNGVMVTVSWLPLSAEELVESSREIVFKNVAGLVERSVHPESIELIALNRL